MINNDKNIEFLPDKIKYNALTKFRKSIIKIPSYVVDEVIKRKIRIEIYYKGDLKADYSWGMLSDSIKSVEKLEYEGKFRNEDIVYRLNHIRI